MPQDIRPQGYFPQGSFIIPTTAIERRRRLAQELAKTGGSGPVQHWAQGAARIAGALGSVLEEGRANQMEQGRYKALAEALSGGGASPDQLMASMDPDLQRIAVYRAQQEQEAAQAARQAAQDEYSRGRDVKTDQRWEQNFAQQAEERAADNARADAAAARAEAAANQPKIMKFLNPDGSESMVSVDRNQQITPLQLPGQGAQANPNAAIPVPTKGMTESEQKSYRFYRRARNANDALSPEEEEALSSGTQNTVEWTRGALENIPYVGQAAAGATNAAHSDAYQRAKIHADRIIASLNYSDSGAQINKDEYARQWNSLIPVFGNGPDAIAAKRKARSDALSSLRATTGRGRPTLDREEQAYAEAAAAAKAGVPQDQIIQRLKENGFDPPGTD